MGIISEDVDRIIMLMEEINVAEKKLQPHDTGHIHTAISYLKSRIIELQKDIALGEAK
tara:strand:+ start:216 stop:389 length:174 start_codon:yes stop_codon:yes gene_type:complete